MALSSISAVLICCTCIAAALISISEQNIRDWDQIQIQKWLKYSGVSNEGIAHVINHQLLINGEKLLSLKSDDVANSIILNGFEDMLDAHKFTVAFDTLLEFIEQSSCLFEAANTFNYPYLLSLLSLQHQVLYCVTDEGITIIYTPCSNGTYEGNKKGMVVALSDELDGRNQNSDIQMVNLLHILIGYVMQQWSSCAHLIHVIIKRVMINL
eukprot:50303_1